MGLLAWAVPQAASHRTGGAGTQGRAGCRTTSPQASPPAGFRTPGAPHPPPVLAAGLAALTGGLAGASHPVQAVATALGVDPAEATGAADDLQRFLRLSPQQPW